MLPSADAALHTLDEAVHLATVGCSPAHSPTLGTFVRGFHRNVPPAELAARSSKALADAALDMWRFAKSRTLGQPKIDAPVNGLEPRRRSAAERRQALSRRQR